MTVTVAAWIEAARIGRRPNGEIFVAEVRAPQHTVLARDDAVRRFKAGQTVLVRWEDVQSIIGSES